MVLNIRLQKIPTTIPIAPIFSYEMLNVTNQVKSVVYFRTALKALLESSLQGSEDTQQHALDIISKTKPEVAWKFFKKNYDRYYQVRHSFIM